MERTWRAAIDEIRQKADTSAVLVRAGVKISRNGRVGHHTALCPWHGDSKTPSLHIFPDGHAHCFGCGWHGDVIDILAWAENISPGDAIKRLAREHGVELPEGAREWIVAEEKRRETSKLLDDVATQCAKWLWDPSVGAAALTYLRRRGLTDETIREARLGFWPAGQSSRILADEGGGAVAADERKPYSYQQLRDAGLRIEGQDSREYDILFGCIVFPVVVGGRCVFLTGRSVPREGHDKRHAKLAQVFADGVLRNPCPPLFGLQNIPRDAKEVVVCEGEIDTLTLQQAGFSAVGLLGVAARHEEAAKLLQRRPRVVLMFDSDPVREDGREPGSVEAARKLGLALGTRGRIATVVYPDRLDGTRPKDPNELLQDIVRDYLDLDNSSTKLREVLTPFIRAAEPYHRWLLDRIATETDQVVQASRVAAELIPFLTTVEPLAREPILDAVNARLKLPKVELRKKVEAAVKEAKQAEKAGSKRLSDPSLVAGSYFAESGRTYWVASGREGPHAVQVTNFEAKIAEQVLHDDGEEVTRSFVLQGKLYDGRPLHPVVIPARQYGAMNWTADWGAAPSISAGPGMRDHARAAIQSLSGEVPERRRFRHTGWRLIGDHWVYLHAGGGIGPDGVEPNIDVDLSGPFRRYVLPAPLAGTDLIEAIQDYLGMLEVAPMEVTSPLFCATWRAPLGSVDWSLFLVGRSGQGKSELAALFQQAWGPDMTRVHLPAAWSSTANALEYLAFTAKDAGFVVDDFAPTGSRNEYEKCVKEADRFFRAVGNQAGRSRLDGVQGGLKATKWPRGLTVATGEDLPGGLASLLARLLPIQVPLNSMRWDLLTVAQRHASSGLYASVMASYVQWLAPNYAETKAGILAARDRIAEAWDLGTVHRRTPRLLADLAVGLDYFLRFAHEVGAIDADRVTQIWQDCTRALCASAATQVADLVHRTSEKRFQDLISTALASGRCHVARQDGSCPRAEIAGAYGWRSKMVGSGSYQNEEWVAQGRRVGWIDGENLYLLPDAAYAAAQELARESGDSLAISARTLGRRMAESNMLLSRDEARQTNTVRRRVEGVDQSVFHLPVVGFVGLSDRQKDQPDNEKLL